MKIIRSFFDEWFQVVVVGFFLVFPFIPGITTNDARQFIPLFIYSLLALSLNIVVGYTGLLHLGIAAFFGIGAYVTGIATVNMFPFKESFLVAAFLSVIVASVFGILLSAPMLRLRGDYLALVTLGFGQVVVYAITNFESITAGTQALTPLMPSFAPSWLPLGLEKVKWQEYPVFYFLTLGILAVVLLGLRNLERSRLGRAWVSMREDELAAGCMGLNTARLKLSALAFAAGLAGLAGCLYAMFLQGTAGPQSYNFNRSIITLSCVILGGIGSRSGVLLGVFLIIGYDAILTPKLDNWLQQQGWNTKLDAWLVANEWSLRGLLKLSNWRLFIFGMALILIMRFRPFGLIPARRNHD
jgi:branched-chain amino acid transport system permease protein